MHEECTGHSIIIISSVLSAAYIEYSRERERTLIDDGYRRGISKEHYRPLESTWTGVHFHLRRSNNRLKVGVCLSTQHTPSLASILDGCVRRTVQQCSRRGSTVAAVSWDTRHAIAVQRSTTRVVPSESSHNTADAFMFVRPIAGFLNLPCTLNPCPGGSCSSSALRLGMSIHQRRGVWKQ